MTTLIYPSRHHLNVSSLIKNLPESDVTFVLGRSDSSVDDLAVRPLSQFPPDPHKDSPVERYKGKYKGLREVNINKGENQGLGIMIMEGRWESSHRHMCDFVVHAHSYSKHAYILRDHPLRSLCLMLF